MAEIKRGTQNNILRFTLKNSSTGVGLTGLTNASAGLIVSTICNNEATATPYTVAAANVETIATLGAYAAPTAGKCRFREVDALNHKGLYEFQFADARFSVASSRQLVISVTGATSLLDADYEIELPDNVAKDAYDIASHASYGNAQLVRSTIPANTLDVSSTGEAGLDFANIKDAAGPKTLTNITVPVVTTLTGHTAQTGDNYARLGAPVGASLAADLVVIDNFVDDLETRFTATRAGYLDNLSAGAVALASACTEARLAELDAANLPTDVAAVKTDTAAILLDTGTDGVVVASASKTGYELSSAGVDAILDDVVEGTLTLRQIMRISLAALAGKSSGGGTATLLFTGADGATTRITATVDANGNRTAITVNGA